MPRWWGAARSATAIIASTLTTLCVFFPLIFMQGMMGIVFQELALTVAFALLASLLVALTLVPMLCAKWLNRPLREGPPDGPTYRLDVAWRSVLVAIERGYGAALHVALRHRAAVLVLCACILAGTWTLYADLGSELLPSVDEGMMYIRLEMPVGTRLDITDGIMADIEGKVYKEAPDVQAMFVRSGLGFRGGGGTHTGFLWARLVDRSQRQESLKDVLAVLEEQTSNYPDGKVRIMERPSDVARLLGSGRSERLEVDVYGFDLARGRALAQELANRIEAVEGVSYVRLNIDDSRPEMQISIDRQKAAALQISTRAILQSIETGIAGTIASRYREGRHEYDIRVRLRPEDRRELADLERIFVATPGGRQVPLRNLTAARADKGPVVIERRNQERAVTIQAGMTGTRDFGGLATEIEALLAAAAVPEGFQVRMGGEREEQHEANRNVHLIVVLSVLLVYMIMAALFESLLHPFVILLAIPFAAVGGILMLWLTGTNVSMPVWIGGIMLVGRGGQ